MSPQPPHPRYWAAAKTTACIYTMSTDPNFVLMRTRLLGSDMSNHHVQNVVPEFFLKWVKSLSTLRLSKRDSITAMDDRPTCLNGLPLWLIDAYRDRSFNPSGGFRGQRGLRCWEEKEAYSITHRIIAYGIGRAMLWGNWGEPIDEENMAGLRDIPLKGHR